MCSTNVLYQNQSDILLPFLESSFLYSTIQSIVQSLTSSKSFFTSLLIDRSTLLVLYNITKLIGAITTYNTSMPSVFTKHNGIEIMSTIFSFSLAPKQRECLTNFVRPVISFLWGTKSNSSVLQNCSMQQLMTLFLWAVENEISSETSGVNVGSNVKEILLKYASLKEPSNASDRQASQVDMAEIQEKQEILVKYAVPRLLALFTDITSYGRFRVLKNPAQLLYYCYQVLLIVKELSTNLVETGNPLRCRFLRSSIIS